MPESMRNGVQGHHSTTGKQGVCLLPHSSVSQTSTGTESSVGLGEIGFPKADGVRTPQLDSREVSVLEKL